MGHSLYSPVRLRQLKADDQGGIVVGGGGGGGGGGERGIILHSFSSIPFRQQQLKANERMDVHCV